MEGSWASENANRPEFHLAEEKDPVLDLLEQKGPEGAVNHLTELLDKDPDNEEIRRELKLLENRLEDLLGMIRKRTGN
ncbi:hypothetical protein KGM48_00450 [Patescibacteria group bacterium]|nr:hypothetical protein [Patescibacteria group bacterium]